MNFDNSALLVTYLSKEKGEFSLREDSLKIIKISREAYDRTMEVLQRQGKVVGQAGEGVSTPRGDEFQALYNGAVVTIVNPKGQYGFGRGIEIEAEDEGGLERAIDSLELPRN
jgi:hypothetical protein